MDTWQDKAQRIIGALSAESFWLANFHNGKRYKKHRPYTIPAIAQELVDALSDNDEERAKAIFMQLLDTPERAKDSSI